MVWIANHMAAIYVAGLVAIVSASSALLLLLSRRWRRPLRIPFCVAGAPVVFHLDRQGVGALQLPDNTSVRAEPRSLVTQFPPGFKRLPTRTFEVGGHHVEIEQARWDLFVAAPAKWTAKVDGEVVACAEDEFGRVLSRWGIVVTTVMVLWTFVFAAFLALSVLGS